MSVTTSGEAGKELIAVARAGPLEASGWYRLPSTEVAERLQVDVATGLSSSEVAERVVLHGPNRLPRARSRSALRTFIDQFRSFLVAILAGAAVLAALVGDLKDVIVISAVVLFNTVLGFVQEHRAGSSLAALQRMVVIRARVRRHGVVTEIKAEDLVPGDVVLVQAGDRVPGDGRWVLTVDLQVDESAFTGESMPVTKDDAPIPDQVVALPDQRCMGFMNTTVTRGRGEIIITNTGEATEIGRLATMLKDAESPPTPLQREIAHLGRRLTLVAAGAVGLVVMLEAARGAPAKEMLLNATALAVAAIPEGLPAVITVTLAVGTSQLAKRGAIVKRLASVETLGATTVICSDKTGTLTLNQMTARRLHTAGTSYNISEDGATPAEPIRRDPHQPNTELQGLLWVCALCNDATVTDAKAVGDPTETALVVLARKGGVDVDAERLARPRLGEIPFNSAAKYMATFHHAGDHIDMYVKGAPDVLLTHCTTITAGDGTVLPLGDTARAVVLAANEDFGQRGLRVLATASRPITTTEWAGSDPSVHLQGLCFEGLVGLADPPRPEARLAIQRCRRAGIDVKMITGDHAATAVTIATELGITGTVITGPELDLLGVEELADRIEEIGVFARVAPEHKVAIVAALQRRSHVVAMTGDGVNDAPALKRADIGIAMGITGTEVSKEAATMVLTNDNFATIVTAVEGGRTIYDNIVKFVTFQLSTNIGAILTIIIAALLDWPGGGKAFLAPLAILWVNLIMDGPPAMALGVDPAGPGTMTRPPRSPTTQILTLARLARLSFYGTVMTAGTLLAYRITAGAGPVTDTNATRGAVVALTTFVFFQLFNIHNARFPDHSALGRHALTNWRLWTASASVLVLQIAAMSWGRSQRIFTARDTSVRLTPANWALAISLAMTILAIEETRKALKRRAQSARGSA